MSYLPTPWTLLMLAVALFIFPLLAIGCVVAHAAWDDCNGCEEEDVPFATGHTEENGRCTNPVYFTPSYFGYTLPNAISLINAASEEYQSEDALPTLCPGEITLFNVWDPGLDSDRRLDPEFYDDSEPPQRIYNCDDDEDGDCDCPGRCIVKVKNSNNRYCWEVSGYIEEYYVDPSQPRWDLCYIEAKADRVVGYETYEIHVYRPGASQEESSGPNYAEFEGVGYVLPPPVQTLRAVRSSTFTNATELQQISDNMSKMLRKDDTTWIGPATLIERYFDVVDNHICVDYVVEESVTHPDAYTDCFIANAPQNVFLNHDTTQAIQVATANVSGGSPAGPTGATYDIWLVNSITNSYYSKCTVPTLITLRALALKQEIVTQNYQFIIFSEAAHSNPERVLAHEIGHVSGLEHNIVDTNLMAASTCDVSVVHGEFVKWDQVGEMASEKENYGD